MWAEFFAALDTAFPLRERWREAPDEGFYRRIQNL